MAGGAARRVGSTRKSQCGCSCISGFGGVVGHLSLCALGTNTCTFLADSSTGQATGEGERNIGAREATSAEERGFSAGRRCRCERRRAASRTTTTTALPAHLRASCCLLPTFSPSSPLYHYGLHDIPISHISLGRCFAGKAHSTLPIAG